MLEFEAEYTNLMVALWRLNKGTSNPYARREIGRSVTQGVPRFDYPRPAGAAPGTADLQRQGFHVLGACLGAAELAEVRARLAGGRLYDSQSLNYQSTLVEKKLFALAERPADVFLATYEFEDVMRCPPLLRLACDPRVVAAVEGYIGCTPTVSAFAVWHSFPGQVDAPAEIFHRDRDCFSFVKLFVYLSEVTDDAGPHEFIRFSHSADTLQSWFQSVGARVELPKLFEGNSRNLSTPELLQNLAPIVVRTTGPAGFGFLEDTYGLHRGTRPGAVPRLIFSVTYTGLPLRYANENDRTYELSRKLTFADAGLAQPTPLQRYLLRFLLR